MPPSIMLVVMADRATSVGDLLGCGVPRYSSLSYVVYLFIWQIVAGPGAISQHCNSR